MNDARQKQAEVNERILAHVPGCAWDSTVAIVLASEGAVHQIGTGILFQVADFCFVVTAAHVLKDPLMCGKTIGISAGDGRFLSTHGDWVATTPSGARGEDDPFDVAVFRLPKTLLPRLSGKRFVRMSEIDFGEQSHSAVFAIFGFQGSWALPSRSADEELILRPIEYLAYRCNRTLPDILDLDPRYHLLIDAQTAHLTTQDGYGVDWTDRAGEVLPLVKGLGGLSGSSVWVIGDLQVPLDQWGRLQPRVVAVETGVYQKSQVIRTSRWTAVTTLIHHAFSELRASIAISSS